MFAWAPIPEQFKHLGSLEFSKLLIEHADVAVAPGVGFGEHGDDMSGWRSSRTSTVSARPRGHQEVPAKLGQAAQQRRSARGAPLSDFAPATR
jgi:aspartate/methionine/tyrosine aminotransferase